MSVCFSLTTKSGDGWLREQITFWTIICRGKKQEDFGGNLYVLRTKKEEQMKVSTWPIMGMIPRSLREKQLSSS